MNLKTSYSSLKDKVVFVLGGSTGIGATLVEEFAKQGSKVAFVGRNEEGEKKIKEGQCLPDKVLPEDIANAALFLASDDSKMITSQDIVVDGGWT